MSDLSQIIEAGTLLIIERGEYSDIHWVGPFRVVRAFKKQDVVDEFRAQWKFDPSGEYWNDEAPQPEEFYPWLIKAGYIEDAGIEDAGLTHSWHVGCYGEFKP